MAATDELGEQFLVYHGTSTQWRRGLDTTIRYRRPLQVATDTDMPSEYAYPGGVIKEFAVDPEARIHHATSEHMGHEEPFEDLTEEEQAEARNADITMFGSIGAVWNPGVLRHVRDIREH